MAVLLAIGLLAYTQVLALPDEPYDNAAVEAPVQTSETPEPTETAPGGLSVDAGSPSAYLYARYPRYARRLDCVYTQESRWDARAYNRRSGAEGLAQMLMTTWVTTPQGKAGVPRTDPIASIDASVFLIEQTPQSWRHWSVVKLGMC